MKKIIRNIFTVLFLTSILIISACTPSAPKKNRYTVTFKDYDGTVLKNEIVEESKNATAPQDPIRYGYIFIGWDNSFENVTENKTITAQYEKDTNVCVEYIVTFKDFDGMILKEEKVIKGESATPPTTPSRVGYNFVGWDKEYTNIQNDLEIYATYETIKYNISYELNGGSMINENPSTYTIEDNFTLKNPLKAGCTFGGWYDNPEFSGNKIEKIKKGTTGNIELYAKYNPINYYITYILDGGTNNELNPNGYSVAEEVKLEAPTKEGYKFIGWEHNGEIIESIPQGTKGNIELVAKWEINKYTIIFDTDGGNVLNNLVFTIESQNLTLPTPVKEEYIFLGWYENDVFVESLEYRDYNLVAKWESLQSLEYELSDDGTYYSVVGIGNVLDEEIIIPSTYNNLPVTKIGESAFSLCENLISVEIPSSIRIIDNSAFSYCSKLKSIKMSEGLTNIGDFAFKSCYELQNINIPSSVKYIGIYAFHYCKMLSSIEIPCGIINIEDYVFSYCTSLTSIKIPNSVKYIEESSFYYCINLIDLEISNSVINIGESAFNNCSKLTSVDIPNSVISIGKYAFKNCTYLESIDIPNSVTSIGEGAFSSCLTLSNINVDRDNLVYKSIDGNLYTKDEKILIQYLGGKKDKEFIIPKGVEIIANNAFDSCNRLEYIEIPNSVTSIGDNSFKSCYNLISIEIPNSVTSIGESAFKSCLDLLSIIIPDSVINMGASVFVNCDNLTIYCEAKSQPENWDSNWNSENCPVEWGYVNIKVYEENGYKYINFGRYPQTVVTDESIINALSTITTTNENGYIEYNGKEYKKMVANPYYEYYTFANGNSITTGNTYYFLVEPIKWRVLEESDGTYKLLSEMILDNKEFYNSMSNRTYNGATINANNYEYSNIRAWLNGYDGSNYNVENYSNNGFLNIAFTETEREFINSILVDNSLSSTYDLSNSYICNNTIDKIYLLSQQDVLNESYGFSNDENIADNLRKGTVTDFGRSNYGLLSNIEPHETGYWWLRSPSYDYKYYERVVHCLGYAYNKDYVGNTFFGVRPAITISTNESKDYKVVFKDYNDNPLKLEYVDKGENATSPNDPYRVGYTFKCWDKEYTNVQGDLEVQALYEPIIYTITFDTDGGNIINDLEFTIEIQNLTLPTPIKEGYEFKGWYENDVLVETVELKNYSLFAKWEEIQSLEFELSSDETYYIVAGIGNVTDTNIVIPSTYKNLPVKEIKADAFMENNDITSVEIPNSVITIGNGAFYKCLNIKKMIIPFVGKTPDGTGYTYFGYIFGAPVAEYSKSYVPTSLKEVQVTGSTILGISAFEGCKSLTTITIPDTVTLIRSNAFKGCTSLTSLDIPNGVTSIESSAFSGCTSLTSMEIPNSVSTIGQRIFSGCTSLEKIIIPFIGETIDGTKNTHLGYIFGMGEYLDNKYVPTNLKEVVITNATSIKNSSFKDCTSLESIVIPNTVTSIGSSAFECCTSLTNIEIPSSVTSIGQCAFSRCTSLESIEIPENITIIELKTFYNCTSLTSIKIPNNVTRIGYDAFTYCESLNNIEIPDSVTTIESGAFDGCTSLESIKISNNVEMIGQGAFRSCNSLTIYCEAEFKPNGWNDDWNSSNCPVIWGFKIYEENGYKYINFGRYPQTVVTDETTISALSSISTTNNLGYIEYKGNEYKVVTASPIDSNYTFINGNIIEYTTYYFLVEPIKWRVLEENNGTYELLSEMILDKSLFYKSYDDRIVNENTIYPNNYEYSNIRAWLNGYDGTSYNVENYTNNGFLNIAFTETEQELINSTLVDNSLASTVDSSNNYICNNTEDKVYLLSKYDMLMNGALGTAYLSDYVRSKRCIMDTSNENYGVGLWWTRTPDDSSSFNSCYKIEQSYSYTNVIFDTYGVRPVMTITLK